MENPVENGVGSQVTSHLDVEVCRRRNRFVRTDVRAGPHDADRFSLCCKAATVVRLSQVAGTKGSGVSFGTEWQCFAGSEYRKDPLLLTLPQPDWDSRSIQFSPSRTNG